MKLIRNSVLSTRIVSTLVPTILPTLIFALIISIVFFLTLPTSADTASAELGVPELIVQIISPVDGDELSIPGVFNVSVSSYYSFQEDKKDTSILHCQRKRHLKIWVRNLQYQLS